MNWGKARAILIVAFLCLDLFLGVRAWAILRAQLGGQNPAGELSFAIEQLRELGVQVSCEPPVQGKPSPFVMVRPLFQDPDSAARAFLGPDLTDVSPFALGSATVYRKGPVTMSVEKGSIIEYLDRGVRPGEPTAPRRAVEALVQFLSGKGVQLEPNNCVVSRQQELVIVIAEQRINGLPFFGCQVYGEVSGQRVRRLRLRWLAVEGPSGYRKALVPVGEVLKRAGREIARRQGRDTIVSVEQGYFTEIYDASQWEAVPAWRVRTGAGLDLILNGYTGELEWVGEQSQHVIGADSIEIRNKRGEAPAGQGESQRVQERLCCHIARGAGC
ncbi:MAG: hypothetical protein ACPLPR_05415 [Bacillota bacterium]